MVCSILLLAACATIKTGSDFDETVDFTKFQSAAWLTQDIIVPVDSEPVSPLAVKRIRQAIEQQLRTVSIQVTDDLAQADLEITAVVGAHREVDRRIYPVHVHAHAHSGWCGPWCLETEYVERSYTEGELSVDLFDRRTGEPVWHGWAQKALTTADHEDPRASIETAVEAMFTDFPTRR